MKILRIPHNWFPSGRMPLAEDGFSVRFGEDVNAMIKQIAEYHGCSRAEVVRALVNRSVGELERSDRVA